MFDQLCAGARRLLFIVAISGAVFVLPAAAAADEITTSPDVTRGVRVRDQPRGAPAAVVGALRPGDRAEVLEVVPYYYKVRLTNGAVGYVSKRYTDPVGSSLASLAAQPLKLHFIDVGQGDSTLIECPNGAAVLIDMGSTSGRSPDEVQDYLIDVLGAHGGDIDTLIISHPDEDHYNLISDVLTDVAVAQAWYVGKPSDYNEDTRRWLADVPRRHFVLTPQFHDRAGQPNTDIDCGPAKVWILAAAVEASKSAKNAKSIVVMVRYGDFEAVITGDATRDTEAVILGRYDPRWLDIDLLRVGHHGSESTSTSATWAKVLSPTLAIVSAGYDNTYGHPRQEVFDRLAPYTEAAAPHGFRSALHRKGAGRIYDYTDTLTYSEAIYATAMSGTIVVTSQGSGYAVQTTR